MKEINDIALVAQVAVFHNKRAFGQLVEKYQSPVRRFLLNLTSGDVELSNDLSQETFIKAYSNITSFKNLSGFSTWLFRIAYNVFYDYLRSRKDTSSLDDVVVQPQSSEPDAAMKLDVHNAMRLLTPNERTCVSLHLMEDLPIDKIARITGMPEGTIKSHISRGKAKLSTYLKNNGYGR